MLEIKYNPPCDGCLHKNICNAGSCFTETKIHTTHPFVRVVLECTEKLTLKDVENMLEDKKCDALSVEKIQ